MATVIVHEMQHRQYIAGVYQGNYAKAWGPYKRISYIGTAGLAPCVGVAIISFFDKLYPPIITVAHLDKENSVEASLIRMRGEHTDKITHVYVESGEARHQLVEVISVLDGWQLHPIVNKIPPRKERRQ